MIQIVSDIESLRLKFTLDLIFKQLLGTKYQLTTRAFVSEEPIIYYSENHHSESGICIPKSSNLLLSKGFKTIDVPFENTGAETILFPVTPKEPGQWNFDLFSAVFYLASRYEEYDGFTPDVHQRFPPEASILHKTKSFEFPLINLWVERLRKEILELWPNTKFRLQEFKFISTIDVDSTFQFREKGIKWSLSGILKDAVHGNFRAVINRIKTISRLEEDAFDVFERLSALHQKYNTEVKYFFLLGDYAPFDKNISWKNEKQAQIIKKLVDKHEVGAHPSYLSNTLAGQLEKELQRLATITGKLPRISRQHFLKHTYPTTYQNLLKNGIKEDYTLGYTSQYGFRAGIASPFYFYDLEKDQVTDLLLFPFCSMDITPLHYYKLTPEQAIEKNKELLLRVKAVNGTFVSLWHNESISGTGRWRGGWPTVYEQLIKDAME